MPVAMETQVTEEEKTWKPGYVKNLVHYFGKLNRSSNSYNGSEQSLSSRNEGLADASRLSLSSRDQAVSPAKSHDISHNASGNEHLQNGDAAVHEQPKAPSYVKLSCAISGYKQYSSPSQQTHHNTTVSLNSAKENGVQIALDNNNCVLNGDTHGGEPVTLEYTPSKNAYVKKVSERFEKISHQSKPVSDNKGLSVSSDITNNTSGVKSQHNGAYSSLNNTNLPATQNPSLQDENQKEEHSNALRESRNGWRNASEPKALSSGQDHPSDNVDSENINFSQAKLAFVHDSKTHQGSSHLNKRSVLDKSHKLGIPADNVVTHASDIALDTSIDSRANGVQEIPARDHDVTDNAEMSPEGDVVTDSINSKLPADEHHDSEHLSQNATHTDNHMDLPTAQLNGDVANGIDCLPKVAHLSCHSSCDSLDTPTPSKDGEYFLNTMSLEEERIKGLCAAAENDLQCADMPDEVSGKVRAAIGKANLLTTKKFKQFKGLCDRNMTQGAEEDFQTTCQDLAGFWDMVLIQVHDVYQQFEEVNKLRQNDWKIASNKSSPLLSKPLTPKTPGGGKRSARSATPKSARATESAKAREEARRKLLEAKKAGRRQRKTSENDEFAVKIVT